MEFSYTQLLLTDQGQIGQLSILWLLTFYEKTRKQGSHGDYVDGFLLKSFKIRE